MAEYAVAGDDAIVGARVRDLGLPRDAVVNVIVRGQEAIPPRGSTRLQAGDHLHLLVRHEAARELAGLIERWGHGPIGPSARPRPRLQGRLPLFSVRRLDPSLVEGDVSRPQRVARHSVVDRLRLRRDAPGALVVLDDGRYAVTGSLVLIGSRQSVSAYARRRLRYADESESAWLQTVVGALAVEESWHARRPPGSGAADTGVRDRSDRDASGSRAGDAAALRSPGDGVRDARQSRSEDRGGVA